MQRGGGHDEKNASLCGENRKKKLTSCTLVSLILQNMGKKRLPTSNSPRVAAANVVTGYNRPW